MLPDDELPSKGPGRAADGNFVLTEIEVAAAPKADPKQAKPVTLQNAAGRLQPGGFDVAKADRRRPDRPGQRLGRLAGRRA